MAAYAARKGINAFRTKRLLVFRKENQQEGGGRLYNQSSEYSSCKGRARVMMRAEGFGATKKMKLATGAVQCMPSLSRCCRFASSDWHLMQLSGLLEPTTT